MFGVKNLFCGYTRGKRTFFNYLLTISDPPRLRTGAIYEYIHTYIHTYHSRFIPEGVAEESQIFFRDIHALPKLVIYEEHCRRDRW
jgi:hypothetical protein